MKERNSQLFKPGQGILNHLKEQGRIGSDIPLNDLRQFQEFEKALFTELQSHEGKDPAVKYAMQSFTKVEMLAIALFMSDEFPAVRRCHDELMEIFQKDPAFDDGISLMTWLLFNFPATLGGEPLGKIILARNPWLVEDVGPFVDEALRSRLGLYEVWKDGRDESTVKELFTNETIVVNQSFGGMARGSIALCRIFSVGGKKWLFGDASEFPANRKAIILDMVANKMSLYFPEVDEVESYITMMRQAGPYWFSIVAAEYRGDILNPDHILRYYER
jgi:hypothetical protein